MIKKTLSALFLGALAVFAFAPFNIWIIIFVSFSGLLLLIAPLSAKKAMIIAFCWGLGFFGAGVHWIYISLLQYGNFSPSIAVLIVFLFVCYLSLYPTIFSYLLQKLTRPYSFTQLIIATPALWQITEFLRSNILNGFAWLQLGYSQLSSPLHVYVPVLGVHFLNLLVPLMCGLLVYLFYHRYKIKQYCLVFFCFICLTWLFSLITWTKTDHSRRAQFALIQGNIKQSIKWNPDQLDKTLADYQRLTKTYLPISDIIIWPEAAVTDTEINQQSYLTKLDRLANQYHTSIAVGIIDETENRVNKKILNSLIVLGNQTRYHYPSKNRYNKRHLVPFGEYVPFEKWLKPLAQYLNIPMAKMSAGANIQPPLVLNGFHFTTAICYEIVLPELVWSNFEAETDFLLTVSNDAWFGNSIAPWQHLQMAQSRAMELGRPLLRSTNNGITAVINQYGKLIKRIPQFKQGVLTISLSPSVNRTPFSLWGNLIYWQITLCLLLMTLFSYIKQKK